MHELSGPFGQITSGFARHHRGVTFDVAADAYDRFMGRWSSILAPRFAAFAGVSVGQRVLDVGCGPGALTSALVALVGESRVAAADPSPPFVAAARQRFPGVEVREASAESLPFADDEFDASLAQLVVHFMADPGVGLREMARVVRGGGIVAACVWDFGGGRGPLGPFWEAAASIDDGAVGEADLPGARDGHLVELLTDVGLRHVEGARLDVSRAFDSFDAWWEPFTMGVGPAGGFVAALDASAATRLRDACRRMLPSGPFELPASAWAARGLASGRGATIAPLP
jgi:SAM-dependent methyltransferase